MQRVLTWLAACLPLLCNAQTLGTEVSFQGRLSDGGQPANGLYDIELCLFDALAGGVQVACAPIHLEVPVEDGLFSVAPDFGPVFTGQPLWLELRVNRSGEAGSVEILAPRQLVRAAPEALHASAADSAVTASHAVSALTASSADVALVANSVAPGAVDAAAIDPTQVQARIAATCPLGSYVRGIGTDGTVLCSSGVNALTTADDAGDAGLYTSIAIGSDGLPVISYHDLTANSLKVAKCTTADCTTGTIVTTVDDPANTVGLYSSIAIGSDGFPVIAYYDTTGTALKVAKCADAACTAATPRTLHHTPNDYGAFASIAIGADGFPVVGYTDLTNGALLVLKCGDADCSGSLTITPVDDSANFVGEYASIAIGTDGNPVLSYYDATAGRLKIAKCTDPTCNDPATITTVPDTSPVGEWTSILVPADGLPVVSYRDLTAQSVKVAKCSSPDCTGTINVAVLDDDGNDLGFQTSIAAASDGLPMVSYHDLTAGALKFARCSDASCTTAVVTAVDDPANTVGEFSSVVTGGDGRPVISYYDRSAGALKVAKCGTPNCR